MGKLNESKLKEVQAAQAKGVVLGLKGISDVDVVPRLDIDVFLHNHPETFNLFIIAFDQLQNETESSDRMGFFQIAGIHGAPKKEWDNMGLKKNANTTIEHGKSTGTPAGYCAHGTATFPTWHRPYLAMLEQTLFLKMVEVANSYDELHKAEYLSAVTNFRLPYWDYFRPRGGPVTFPGVLDGKETTYPFDYSLPKVFTEKSITVFAPPNDKATSLERGNPFRSHPFNTTESNTIEWKDFAPKPEQFPRDRTVRYPNPGNSADPENINGMNNVLNELRMDSNRLVLTMLEDAIYSKYEIFASAGQPVGEQPDENDISARAQVIQASGSLEALHGLYHGAIGGIGDPLAPGGHMTRISVAAFDPVFWVHHGQIERLFTLWQATHKDKKGSWFSNSNQARQPLLPFRKDNAGNDPKTCWNSNDSATTEAFGYTYEEVDPTKYKSPEEVLKHFQDLYEWSVPLNNTDLPGEIPEEMEPLPISNSAFFKKPEPEVSTKSFRAASKKSTFQQVFATPQVKADSGTETSEPGYAREWYIDDQFERMALNGAFSIFYCIRDDDKPFPANVNYTLEPSLAGITHNFAAPREVCDNCGDQEEQAVTVTNTVPVTSLLLDYVQAGKLESLRPEHVKPFITRGLKWRIVTVDAKVEDSRALAKNKGFRLSISCKKSRLPRGSGDVSYEVYPEIIQDIIGQASSTLTT